MKFKHRIGLMLLMVGIISTLLFNGKPDLTMELWNETFICTTITTIIGAMLFISRG